MRNSSKVNEHPTSATENHPLKVMRNAGPREKREGCCNTIMPSAANTLFAAEELSQSGLSRVGLEIRPKRASTERLQVQSLVALGWPGSVLTAHLFEIVPACH